MGILLFVRGPDGQHTPGHFVKGPTLIASVGFAIIAVSKVANVSVRALPLRQCCRKDQPSIKAGATPFVNCSVWFDGKHSYLGLG